MSDESNRIAAATSMYLANNLNLKKTGENRVRMISKENVIQDTLETSHKDEAGQPLLSKQREIVNHSDDPDSDSEPRLDLLG